MATVLPYLDNVLHGDFGPSYSQRSQSVSDIISGLSRLFEARACCDGLRHRGRRDTWSARRATPQWLVDYLTSFTAIVGISTPPYVVVSFLVLVLASRYHLLATGGWGGIFSTKIIIPAFALSLYPAAVLARTRDRACSTC